MSGIIGSAGSKSGVIGTTELDYEEGTWDCVLRGYNPTTIVTFTPINTGRVAYTYAKVGKLVTVHCTIIESTSSAAPAGTAETKIEGFPFTCGDSHGIGSPVLLHSAGTDLNADSVPLLQSNLTWGYFMSHAGDGYGFSSFVNSGTTYMYWSLTYIAA